MLGAISLLSLPLYNSWMVVEKEFVVGLSPGICALFSHVGCQGAWAQPEGLQTGGRTGQLWLGATSFPVISALWFLDGIYSAAVWTPQQAHLFSYFYWTVLFCRVGLGRKCSVVRCCRYPLIWCIDNHRPTLLWKLLPPGSGLIQCIWIWGISMNMRNMHWKDLYWFQI